MDWKFSRELSSITIIIIIIVGWHSSRRVTVSASKHLPKNGAVQLQAITAGVQFVVGRLIFFYQAIVGTWLCVGYLDQLQCAYRMDLSNRRTEVDDGCRFCLRPSSSRSNENGWTNEREWALFEEREITFSESQRASDMSGEWMMIMIHWETASAIKSEKYLSFDWEFNPHCKIAQFHFLMKTKLKKLPKWHFTYLPYSMFRIAISS